MKKWKSYALVILNCTCLYSSVSFSNSFGEFEITGVSWKSYGFVNGESQLAAAKADAWAQATVICGENNGVLKKSDWTLGWESWRSPYSDESVVWRWARAVFECQY